MKSLAFALLVVCALAAAPYAVRAEDTPKLQAVPQGKWDALFDRTSGWTGGDVAGTVDLGQGRVLWVFGDTWIGEVAKGAHVPGAQMVNNSMALQTADLRKMGDPPTPSELRFHWDRNDTRSHPAAWIVPDPLQLPANATIAHSERPHGWYWPTGGGAVVSGPEGKPRLAVFLFHIGKAEGRTGVWAFKGLGSVLAMIDNFDQPVEKWQVKQYEIPSAISADAANADPRLRETSWGMAALRQPGGVDNRAGLLYVYGIRNQAPLNRQLLLARVPADAVQEPSQWRFYAGDGKWSDRHQDAAPIAEDLVNELSVEECTIEGRPLLVMVHSEPLFGRHIFLRTASRPEGPWSKRVPVYSVPEVDRNRSFFTYAAKGHMPLSRRDELRISYVVNAHDFGAMFQDATIYRPRFISVPLSVAAGH